MLGSIFGSPDLEKLPCTLRLNFSFHLLFHLILPYLSLQASASMFSVKVLFVSSLHAPYSARQLGAEIVP